VALNARERLISSQTINIVDGEMIVQEFSDILPVCVVAYIKDADRLKDNIYASVRQGDKTIDAYEVEIQDLTAVETRVVREKWPPVKDREGPARQESAPADKKGKEGQAYRESVPVDKKDRKKTEKEKPDQNSGDKGREKPAGGENKENITIERQPEPVFTERKIVLLHRVQLFLYFDLRQVKTFGQAALVVNMPKERERRFNFNFNSIN
jgi:hypothetical protein